MAMEAIRTERLSKRYGGRRGLDGLDLEVRTGEVFGHLGPNGAGKTTTIRLLLDLIRPTAGSARVLGVDPRAGGVSLRRRMGYLPGDFVVDGRQTGRELLTFLGNLRGGVPRRRIESLAASLDLDLDVRIGRLSRGNRQKVGLVQAFMHSPELLVLDEPSSGLDPLVQQRFLSLVREARTAGQTVFMSSHVLSEVQQSADRVGIIRDGRLVAVEAVERLRERAPRRVEIVYDAPVPSSAFADLPSVRAAGVEGTVLRCLLVGPADPLVKAAARFTTLGLTAEEPDLEELFLTYYDREEGGHAA